MRRFSVIIAITVLLVGMVSISWAAVNLNSSRSNVYRVTYDTSVVSPAQASALLVELEKLGPADEAKLKMWLPANFKRLGIEGDRIKKISIRKVVDKASPILILLLANPADEAQALAVSNDGGPQGPKKGKGTK